MTPKYILSKVFKLDKPVVYISRVGEDRSVAYIQFLEENDEVISDVYSLFGSKVKKRQNTKPCPFCGNKLTAIMPTETCYYLYCFNGCGACGPVAETEAEAIKKWNCRK